MRHKTYQKIRKFIKTVQKRQKTDYPVTNLQAEARKLKLGAPFTIAAVTSGVLQKIGNGYVTVERPVDDIDVLMVWQSATEYQKPYIDARKMNV